MKFIRYISFFVFTIYGVACAVDIGSDTAVTRFDTQQILDDGDRIAGFAALYAGFELQDPFVNGIFDSFFQVSGKVALNSGILTLNQDLVLYNDAFFSTFGSIVGNHHVLELSSSITCIPSPTGGISEFACDLVRLVSQAEIANVFALGWAFNSDFIAVGLASNAGVELLVYSFDGETITLKDSIEYGVNVNAVRWHPSEYRLAVGTSSAAGDELFIYDFDSVAGTLTLTDSDEIGGDVTALAWRPEGDYLSVGTSVNTREVSVYPVSGAGILGTRVDIDLGGNADVARGAMDWSISGDYIAVGRLKSGSPELYVLAFDTTGPSIVTNVSLDISGDVNGVSWSPTHSSILAVADNGGTQRLGVYNHDGVAGMLTLQAFAAETTSPARGVDWSFDGGCIYLVKEVQPADQELKVYSYHYDTKLLTFINGYDFSSDLFAVKASEENSYVVVGGADNSIVIYQGAAAYIQKVPYMLTDVELKLNSDICFNSGLFIFSGDSTINGRGYHITFKETATVRIAPNSNLYLDDLTILDLHENHLGLTDDSSTLVFDNVILSLDENYTITVGKFYIERELRVMSNLAFIQESNLLFTYQSTNSSVIESDGRFILEQGVTFSYDPPISAQGLLQFKSSNSRLILRGGTLYASNVGLNLTKGIMEINAKSFISAAGTTADTGISFGDGISSANNFFVRWAPASVLETMPGYIRLQNV